MKINTDIMKKVLYIILAGIFVFFILIISCPEIFNGKEEDEEIDFNKIFEEIEDDYTNWFIEKKLYGFEFYKADNEEDAAIEDLYQNIEISIDGSYFNYNCHVLNQLPFSIETMEALEIIRLINLKLGLPHSVLEKIRETGDKDGEQTYEGENITITWSFYDKTNYFNFTYQKK